MKRQVFYLLIVVLLLGALIPSTSSVQAQSNPTVDRYIDMVMAHLTDWLSFDRPITRSSHFWRWSQNVYTDTSLGCPAPSRTYATITQRGYRIIISVDGIDYDYRVAEDGTYFILCGPDGMPLYDSSDPSAFAGSGTSSISGVSVPPSPWYAWGYSEISDTLYLFGTSGLITSLPRPNVGLTLISSPRMAISPDGRYMVQHESTTDGDQVTFYNFATGELYALYGLMPNESVQLGFTSGSGQYGANPHIFNPGSTRVAIGIRGPDIDQWRLVVFDVALGTVVAQLSYLDFASTLSGVVLSGAPLVQTLLNDISSGIAFVFPNVVYYDSAGNVHMQIIPSASGGAPYYPAVQWNPNTNRSNISPYVYSQLDVLTTNGNMLYATENPFVPALPPEGPFTSFNQIELGNVSGTSSVPTGLYGNSSRYLFEPQFASIDGSLITFIAATPSVYNIHALYGHSGGTGIPVYEELSSDTISVIGVDGGAVALELLPGAQPNVVFAQIGGIRTTVYTPSSALTDFGLVWASPPGTGFGLSTVASSFTVSPTIDVGPVLGPPPVMPTSTPVIAGTVYCAGTIPSRLSVGIRARVTFTDGTPLRLRQTPGGTFIRDLPEGTPFTIIGGPSCQGAYTWWNIQLDDGAIGWSAEGDIDTYFIEPIS